MYRTDRVATLRAIHDSATNSPTRVAAPTRFHSRTPSVGSAADFTPSVWLPPTTPATDPATARADPTADAAPTVDEQWDFLGARDDSASTSEIARVLTEIAPQWWEADTPTKIRARAAGELEELSGLSGLPWAEAHDLSPKAHHHLSYDASAAAAAARSRPETPTAGAPSSAGGGGSGSGSASASASFKRRASPAASPALAASSAAPPCELAATEREQLELLFGLLLRRARLGEARFFDAIAEPGERRLTRAEWQDAFGLGWNAPVVYRIFDVVDAERKGSLARSDFVDGLAPLVARDGAARLHFLFDVLDIDGSGKIEQTDLLVHLTVCQAREAVEADGAGGEESGGEEGGADDEGGGGAGGSGGGAGSSGGSSGGGAAGPTMSAAQLEAVAWRTVAEADYDGDAAIGRADFAKFAAARPALVRGLTERLGMRVSRMIATLLLGLDVEWVDRDDASPAPSASPRASPRTSFDGAGAGSPTLRPSARASHRRSLSERIGESLDGLVNGDRRRSSLGGRIGRDVVTVIS